MARRTGGTRAAARNPPDDTPRSSKGSATHGWRFDVYASAAPAGVHLIAAPSAETTRLIERSPARELGTTERGAARVLDRARRSLAVSPRRATERSGQARFAATAALARADRAILSP